MNEWLSNNWWWFIILVLWSLFWKGMALWRAAQKRDKSWFIALLVLNTAGLLEMFYLFIFAKRFQQQK
jgi:hypothetical protein